MTSLAVRPAMVVAQRDRRAGQADKDRAEGPRAWALIARMQADDGDQAAAAELYAMYSARVLRYLTGRCSDQELAEDLAGDVWVKALANTPRLARTDVPPLAWLLTIARNRLFDYWKSGAATKTRSYDSPYLALPAEPVDVDPEPAEVLARYITSRKLLAAVLDLTGPQRDVLIFRFFREHSVEETATAMGLKTGAVKALQYRAVRALANVLPRADFLPEGA